jgi:ribonuclease P protein component
LIRRIRGRDAFERLAREGTRIRGSSLWCAHLPQPTATAPAIAFSIGRAVGPAVVRNRLRRRLRAVLRTMADRDELPSGLLLIGAGPSAVELTFDELAAELRTLVRWLAAGRPMDRPPSRKRP